MRRDPRKPFKVSAPRIGERPSIWALWCGMRYSQCRRVQSPKALESTTPWRGWNKTDVHMCGTCGRYQFLSGKSRNRRTFTVIFPMWFGILVMLAFVISAMGMTIPNEPNAGEPTVAAGILLGLVLFLRLSAINDRLEEIIAIAPTKGEPVEPA